MKPKCSRRNCASSSASSSDVARPEIRYSPSDGRSRQPRIFISVDLPEPDAPMIATISPRSMVRFTWFRTVVKSSSDGYCRETPLSERSGVSLMSETVRGRNGNLIIGDDFVPLVQTRTDFGVDLVGNAGFDRAFFDLVCACHHANRGLARFTRVLESGHRRNQDIFSLRK